ncbi:MAG: 16S rRNA (uracil(1498)-N(3))-methyltransferase [Pseudomonadota bacterium]
MIPRLYIDAPLETDAVAPLSAAQAHYLKNVLRRDAGESLLLFNGRDGEFAADIVELKKKGGLARVVSKTREQENEPDLHLLFAPVKRGALENIVQKAVEIGAGRLTPIITERTVAPRVNIERLQAIAVEAAEQCGRLTAPKITAPEKFASVIDAWPDDRLMMFCDEAGDDEGQEWGGRSGRAMPALEALKAFDSKPEGWSVLTGPEGGFTPEERAALRAKDFVIPATLGPRILRADTAVIAALTLWQAALGDWRRP